MVTSEDMTTSENVLSRDEGLVSVSKDNDPPFLSAQQVQQLHEFAARRSNNNNSEFSESFGDGSSNDNFVDGSLDNINISSLPLPNTDQLESVATSLSSKI